MKATETEEVSDRATTWWQERSTERKELNQEKALRQERTKFSLPEVWRGAGLAQGKLQAAMLQHVEMGAQQRQSLKTSTYGPGP